jgi:hypothetical protein
LQTISENFCHAQNSICNIDIPNITLSLSFFLTIQYVHAQIMALFVPVAMRGKVYTVELVSLRRRDLRGCINFTNFAFLIKCHFNIGI